MKVIKEDTGLWKNKRVWLANDCDRWRECANFKYLCANR